MSLKHIKVLHIISDIRRGGRERQLSILASNLNSSIENHILAFHKTESNYLDEYKLNINYCSAKGKFKRFSEIINYIKKNKIDLIHTWGNSETLYAMPAARVCKIPLLNGSIRHGIRKNTFSHLFRSMVLKKSGYILANSYAGIDANRIKFKKNKHFVIYNGIDKKFFVEYNKEKRLHFESENQLPPGSIIFISVANFVPYKDYNTILKSLSEINRDGISFYYIIIGKGPLQEEIEKQINSLGLESKVSIYSDNPDIPALLSISDIMIHSSLGEGCSNAVLEAKAAGLIVAASDRGGTKEIINKWDFLFAYNNREDLVFKIKSAVQLMNNEQNIRNKIQNDARERFSVEMFVNNYQEVVDKILNNFKTAKVQV
jgi:glycosyltransferase involved in cell wall biosynthesis